MRFRLAPGCPGSQALQARTYSVRTVDGTVMLDAVEPALPGNPTSL
jgi:hypothetical protein